MKQSVSPVVAVIVVLVVIGVAAFAWMHMSKGQAGAKEGEQPPGMPQFVQDEFKRRGAGQTGPPPSTGPTGATPLTPGAGGKK